VEGILTPLALLMPAFSLPVAPRPLSPPLHSELERSPTARAIRGSLEPAASEASLSPVTFSAPEHLTSELLRTLSRVAASKPTSWLSRHSDIVHHLAST
jgi:hypothetical protein